MADRVVRCGAEEVRALRRHGQFAPQEAVTGLRDGGRAGLDFRGCALAEVLARSDEFPRGPLDVPASSDAAAASQMVVAWVRRFESEINRT